MTAVVMACRVTARNCSIGVFFEKFLDILIDVGFVSLDLKMLLQCLVLFGFERTIGTFEEKMTVMRFLV